MPARARPPRHARVTNRRPSFEITSTTSCRRHWKRPDHRSARVPSSTWTRGSSPPIVIPALARAPSHEICSQASSSSHLPPHPTCRRAVPTTSRSGVTCTCNRARRVVAPHPAAIQTPPPSPSWAPSPSRPRRRQRRRRIARAAAPFEIASSYCITCSLARRKQAATWSLPRQTETSSQPYHHRRNGPRTSPLLTRLQTRSFTLRSCHVAALSACEMHPRDLPEPDGHAELRTSIRCLER